MAQRDFYAKDNRRQQLLIKSLHTELGEEDAERRVKECKERL